MTSNIEHISQQFRLPLSYQKDASVRQTNPQMVRDLELIETIDASSALPFYESAFTPRTVFGRKVLEQWPNSYTHDVAFIQETQKLLKTYHPVDEQPAPFFQKIMDVYDEIISDGGFKEKYQYLDWAHVEHLNRSATFLQVMSMYNLASPVLSLLTPVFILLIPFFIIQAKGLQLTWGDYLKILHGVVSNHALGKLFTQFHSVKMEEKIYMLVSAFFYVFSIYQNVLTCIRFHRNMKKIHATVADLRAYIAYTQAAAEEYMSSLSRDKNKFPLHEPFLEHLREELTVLTRYKKKLDDIGVYNPFFVKSVLQMGNVLETFYQLHCDKDLHNSFLYSFGFHGYLDNVRGLQENLRNGKMHFATIQTKEKRKKGKKEKKPTTEFKGLYSPVTTNPVYNDVLLSKNLVITGPNASGKTTLLKSCLVNVLLSQQVGCGFYSSVKLTPYQHLHCYLNIPDTSGRDSLFQAEARRCKNILDEIEEKSGDRHLCVFDELYSGTNPEEAVSSAYAFLLYLDKGKNIDCLLTTHFYDLCQYLEKGDRFTNMSMKTDVTSKGEFVYLYELTKGISKVKGGLQILTDMNYPKEILDEANRKEKEVENKDVRQSKA